MFQAWRKHGVVTYAGYILGFPSDTPESIARDIKIIQRELPVDVLEFFYLTPLPGSQDHKELFNKGAWMDPDMNNYDLIHATAEHPSMSLQQWRNAYKRAWDEYYSLDHIKTLLRRARVDGIPLTRVMRTTRDFYACYKLEEVHPLDGGVFRRKYRLDRRPGLKTEFPVFFHIRYVWETLNKYSRYLKVMWDFNRIRKAVESDPEGEHYMDIALSPVSDDELESYDMFTATDAARSAVEKARKRHAA